jgi:hypothetical protein
MILIRSLGVNLRSMNLRNDNKLEIINTIKILIYKESRTLLEKVDFEDDNVFLEPLLFAYFNSKKENLFSIEMLEEIVQGYFLEKEGDKIFHSYNENNIAYVPNLGYFENGKKVENILKVDVFEIQKEIHPTQKSYFREVYKGHILNYNPVYNSVWKRYHKELEKSILIIKNHLPDFYQELFFANRKIYLHDNPKILNFTTIETLGVLYFYVIGNENLIYFIEELIHQGSHNFLYYVVHNRKDYFKIDVDNLIMRDFTKQEWDYRNIYGAFHGLYTVTKRVECFDILLSNNVFCGREKHELLGRLTDQFGRHRTGLELLNLEKVFTEQGMLYYKELDTKCVTILNKYKKLLSIFDISSVDLDFRYNGFCLLNPIEEFYKNEEKGIFNF